MSAVPQPVPYLTETKQDWVLVYRDDPEKYGFWQDYREITALDQQARRRFFLELAADGTVAAYQQFEKSSVTLPDGEVLTGQPKNHQPRITFGTLSPIEDVTPSQTALDDEFVVRNAERVAALTQSWRNQGHTHMLRYRTGYREPVGGTDDLVVRHPETGATTILGPSHHHPPPQYQPPRPNM